MTCSLANALHSAGVEGNCPSDVETQAAIAVLRLVTAAWKPAFATDAYDGVRDDAFQPLTQETAGGRRGR